MWRSKRAVRLTARVIRWAFLAGVFGILELLTRRGAIDPLSLPRPSRAVIALVDILPTAEFRSDLIRTLSTVGLSVGIGLVVGIVLGVVSWRIPLLGRITEPYLITLYAMPTVVFYPVLLALMGLGTEPIITLAATAAFIPVALNTTIALRSVEPVLPKMGISLNCSRWQIYRKVLFPAAVPLAVPGVRLGFIYAFIATVAMEFFLASSGLGYRIGFDYHQYRIPAMYGLIMFVALLAIVVNVILDRIERRIRRDML